MAFLYVSAAQPMAHQGVLCGLRCYLSEIKKKLDVKNTDHLSGGITISNVTTAALAVLI
jgi:hypothetical protein